MVNFPKRKRTVTKVRRVVRRRVFKARPKISLRRKGMGKMSLQKMLGKPRVYTPLMWEQTQYLNVAANGYSYLVYYPMNPAPNDNTTGSPAAGTVLYTGLPLYAQYYAQARVHAAKISLQVTSSLELTDVPVQICMVAVPYQIDGRQNISTSVSALSGLTWDQLSSYPGAVRVPLQQGNAGKIGRLRMFRKTASMFNKSSIRDDTNSSIRISSTAVASTWSNPANSWYYFVLILNGNTDERNITVNAKLTGYFEFYNTNLIYENTLTYNAPEGGI